MTLTGGRPLARFSVLDLTTVRSGPTCTKILADFGADVLRVERPGGEGRERAAPMTGEHTREVPTTLGNDAASLDALVAEGVIEQHKGETK